MQRWADAPTIRPQSGFTLLVLVIVIILVILLFLTAWWQLLPLRGSAESAHVASTVGAMRSALGLHVAERIVNDSLDAVAQLDGSNPVAVLEQPPGNYIGAIPSSGPDIDSGAWYFEESTGRLGYRVRHPQYLAGSPEEPVDLYWRIQVRFDDSNDNGRLDIKTDSVRAVSLKALHDQRWQSFDAAGEVTDPQE